MRTALVIGAGVSGCACAAAMVEAGVRVQLLSSALDRVGHPGYGPVLVPGGWSGVVETLASLPRVIRDVWVEAGLGSDGADGVLVVDCRKISIELKRALEPLAGLDLRQGLVNDVRIVPVDGAAEAGTREPGAARVAVETVFGEVFEADAVVLAVGLGLGGEVLVGRDVLPGGRYGETRAEGLVEALQGLGAQMAYTEVRVGPRFLGESNGALGIDEAAEACASGEEAGPRSGRREMFPLTEMLRGETRAREGTGGWPAEYPPAAHWTRELEAGWLYVWDGGRSHGERLLLPDGCALGERYVRPDGATGSGLEPLGWGGHHGRAVVASRLGQEVRGLVVMDLDDAGRLRLDGAQGASVWVTGRAGGSADYLGSLASGTRTGLAVAEALGTLAEGVR